MIRPWFGIALFWWMCATLFSGLVIASGLPSWAHAVGALYIWPTAYCAAKWRPNSGESANRARRKKESA